MVPSEARIELIPGFTFAEAAAAAAAAAEEAALTDVFTVPFFPTIPVVVAPSSFNAFMAATASSALVYVT